MYFTAIEWTKYMDYSYVSFLGFSFIPLKIKVEMEFSMSEQMSELL